MSLLDKARAIVDSDRQSQYGDPVENTILQAQVASIIMGRPISALDCNAVNLAQKIVRMGKSDKEDTRADVIGYTEIRDRLMKAAAEAKKISMPWDKPSGAPTGDGELSTSRFSGGKL